MNRDTMTVKHLCNHVYTYLRPENDPNAEIATGLALVPCVECAAREGDDWMDCQKRAERERMKR